MEKMSKQERREMKRKLRKERRKQENQMQKSTSRKNSFKMLGIVIGVVVLIAVGVFAFSSFTGNDINVPGPYDEFAKCTAEKGLTMYGAYWCPHCQRQKLNFGNSFRHVNYVECDARDPEGKGQPGLCNEMGIESYPTWIYNDQRFFGVQSLERLADITGCKLKSS